MKSVPVASRKAFIVHMFVMWFNAVWIGLIIRQG